MPIKKENKGRYPENWKQIREEILQRAKNRCEFCGIENKSILRYEDNKLDSVCRPSDLEYQMLASIRGPYRATDSKGKIHNYKNSLVVLTIAHLDQTPEHCEYDNLKALCQRCHNKLDAPYRALHRKIDSLNAELERYKKFKSSIDEALYMDAYDEKCLVSEKDLYISLKKDLVRIRDKFDKREDKI